MVATNKKISLPSLSLPLSLPLSLTHVHTGGDDCPTLVFEEVNISFQT